MTLIIRDADALCPLLVAEHTNISPVSSRVKDLTHLLSVIIVPLGVFVAVVVTPSIMYILLKNHLMMDL